MTVRKDWAPRGAERFLNLVSLGFFDACPLHRAVKNFLVQFGVSSDPELEKSWGRSTFPDDPLRPEFLPLPAGTLAFAGGGKNSRTTQLWMSFNQGVAGKELWEAPVGYVHETDGLSVVKSINTEYGDAKCFGGHAPDPHAGLALLRTDNPNLDYFESCSIIPSDQAAIAAHSSSLATVELTQVEVIPPGEKRSLETSTGHVFVAKRGGPQGEILGQVRVSELDQMIDLGGLKL
jgi:cyclophilin family peptidyl-prolyl cis-trans isomerase